MPLLCACCRRDCQLTVRQAGHFCAGRNMSLFTPKTPRDLAVRSTFDRPPPFLWTSGSYEEQQGQWLWRGDNDGHGHGARVDLRLFCGSLPRDVDVATQLFAIGRCLDATARDAALPSICQQEAKLSAVFRLVASIK